MSEESNERAASGSLPMAALILAGERGGVELLATSASCSHKALVPVGGVPMLVRVVRTLQASSRIAGVTVSIDDPAALAAVPELRDLLRSDRMRVHKSLDSPSASVRDYLGSLDEERPLLVTTADHPLLTGAMIEHFTAQAERLDADVVIALVAESCLRTAFPTQQRTLVRLGSEAYSGANLFVFRGPRAARAAEFWVRAERHRKNPPRLVSMFGPWNLALYALGRLELESALRRASRKIGARVEAVLMPFPECAVDVDKPADLELVRRILAAGGDRAA